jgi:aldehyde:ferredoxin oxidoreductase
MATGNGYAGKILRVDLTSEKITEETLSQAELRKYLGGAGFGAKYLYAEVPPTVQWNDPENRLIIASGPLGGTRMGGSGTISISTKGCLTNGAVSTQANGYMGAYMKFSGYDGIIFQGAAKRWVYLYMHDGKAELKDARAYVGLDTWQLEDAIKKDLGYTEKQMSVFGIGPAGENLVKFAGIFGDKDHAAGHNGSGAVMGSKKLKAFCAIRGDAKMPVNDPEKLVTAAEAIWEQIQAFPGTLRTFNWGTGGTYESRAQQLAAGTLPIKNYTTDVFPEGAKFTTQWTREHHDHVPNPCWACRMHHLSMVTIKGGPYNGITVEDPEYELYAEMGPTIGVTDPDATLVLANLLTRLGLEGNEAGFLVSMVIELYESGKLKKEDTDGLELTWGNVASVRTLLERISRREGKFANQLAEGTFRTVKALGPEAEARGIFSYKGFSPRGHDHRAMWREMFDTVTSDIAVYESSYGGPPDPDTHTIKNIFSPEDVSAHTALSKGRRIFEDCLGTCCFATRVPLKMVVDCLNAATGWDVTPKEAADVGYRAANLFRAFNIKNGIGMEVERPSERWSSTPVDGPAKGISVRPHWDGMMENYYKLMGWDIKTGKPFAETLNKLGLENVARDMWK